MMILLGKICRQIFGEVHFFGWVCSKAKGRCHKACTVAPFAMMIEVNMTLMIMRIVNISLIFEKEEDWNEVCKHTGE